MVDDGWDKKDIVLFVHWGIRGAKRNDHNTDADGVPAEWLKDYKRVFSGHYHYRNQFENIQYIGSPFQQNFSEMNQDKGVLIYDAETDEVRFIEIEGMPKHYEVEIYWENNKAKIKKHKAIKPIDFVRAKVRGDSVQVSKITKDSIKKFVGAHSIKIDRDVQENSISRMNIEINEIYNEGSMMRKYVDFVGTDLNKEKLLKVGDEILRGM